MFARKLIALSCLIASLGLCGCGPKGPETASVEGNLTLDGKPLVGATIMFIPENGRPGSGATDDQGHYILYYNDSTKGAIPGQCKVMVTTKRDATVDSSGNPVPGSPETIPMQYNAKSELKFNVEAGKKNVANFDLESKGQILKGNSES